MENNYFKLYLKYKSKYLDLKNKQIGGSRELFIYIVSEDKYYDIGFTILASSLDILKDHLNEYTDGVEYVFGGKAESDNIKFRSEWETRGTQLPLHEIRDALAQLDIGIDLLADNIKNDPEYKDQMAWVAIE